MSRGLGGYADLLRVIAVDPDLLPVAAKLLGFDYEPGARKTEIPGGQVPTGPSEIGAVGPVGQAIVDPVLKSSHEWPDNAQPSTFWLPTRYWKFEKEEVAPPLRSTASSSRSWKDPAAALPVHQPIARWQELLPRLRAELQRNQQSSRVDTEAVVSMISRAETVSVIPRAPLRRWGSRIQLIVDNSLHLVPFRHDQRELRRHLEQIYGVENVEYVVHAESWNQLRTQPMQKGRQEVRGSYRFPSDDTTIIVVSDFGALMADPTKALGRWLPWVGEVIEREARVIAIVPCDPHRIHRTIRSAVRVLSWQTPRQYRGFRQRETRRACVQELLAALANTSKIEPGLLRDIRREVFGYSDASLEADFWSSSQLSSRHLKGASVDPEVVNDSLAACFLQLSPQLRQRALAVIRRWRQLSGDEAWLSEIWRLDDESRELISVVDRRAADDRLAQIASQLSSSSIKLSIDACAWVARMTDRLPDQVLTSQKRLRELYQLSHPEESDRLLPGAHPSEVTKGERHTIHVSQQGNELRMTRDLAGKRAACGFIGVLESTNGWVTCEEFGDDDFWKSGQPPTWACDWGHDEYGAWAEFQVLSADMVDQPPDADHVKQRLRWVPAGTFLMGSPEDDDSAYGDEKPQHEVTLTRGFWMFDTPVTQELWTAVMGSKPAHFTGGQRPVESISWEDAQQFVERLNGMCGGDGFVLPTEAQWERACRAGTQTRYAFGDRITDQQARFGVGYDEGTCDVASFPPNHWGLYDVHGNVREWCQDYWSNDYRQADQLDPTGPTEGHERVLRGGSWSNDALFVRSAYRFGDVPGSGSYVGFRCAQVQLGAEPMAEDAGRQAERRSHPQTFGGAEPARVTADAVAQIVSAKPRIVLGTDLHSLEMREVARPSWASAIGRDSHGLWSEFTLAGDAKVVQRMRWIPPGRFQMGSPKDDSEVQSRELQHEVTISHGYWLFDTSVTQEFWVAVMPENPSGFPGEARPVERVSWQDCQEFMGRVVDQIPGLDLTLPTEAEWEHACRAGTTTRYAFGDELSADHARFGVTNQDGTVAVMTYAPNSWGLYDMHGNVFEWCHDWYADYSERPEVDPTGPAEGHERVLRGGGWSNDARYVRSAYRDGSEPGHRSLCVGFRCAQVQKNQQSEPASEGS